MQKKEKVSRNSTHLFLFNFPGHSQLTALVPRLPIYYSYIYSYPYASAVPPSASMFFGSTRFNMIATINTTATQFSANTV